MTFACSYVVRFPLFLINSLQRLVACYRDHSVMPILDNLYDYHSFIRRLFCGNRCVDAINFLSGCPGHVVLFTWRVSILFATSVIRWQVAFPSWNVQFSPENKFPALWSILVSKNATHLFIPRRYATFQCHLTTCTPQTNPNHQRF